MTLIFGIMRVVNFTHGELYTFGAYMVFFFTMTLSANFFLALVFAMVLGIALGAAIEFVLLRRLRGASIDTTMLVMIGAWIAMQVLMRRPEIAGFIAVSPPANMYEFTFLAPCPSSGLIVHGSADELVPEPVVATLAEKLSLQKNITIDYDIVDGADHFFQNHLETFTERVDRYLERRLKAAASS